MIGSLFGTSGSSGNSGSISSEVYNKVAKAMASQNTVAPKLNAALDADQTKLSAIGQLRSALASFQNVTQAMTGKGLTLAATSSAPGVVAAAASSRAAAGSHVVEVEQLAQGQVLRSRPRASANDAVGSGIATRLTLEFGTTSGSSFAADATGGRRTVLIPGSANSLQEIADAINGANAGVSAKLAVQGGNTVLELTSPTGAASSLRIDVSGDPALKDLLSYDPAKTGGLTQVSAARNARLTLDGTAVERPANTLVDAIAGTTLTLASTGKATVSVAEGAAQYVDNIAKLVDAYNGLNAQLGALAGESKNDGSTALVRRQLAQAFSAGGALDKLGITWRSDGKLAFDAAALRSAVAADPAAAARLFAADGQGVTEQLNATLKGLLDPGGTLVRKSETLNKGIAVLNAKRDALEQTLTARATALAKAYSMQESYAQGGTFGSSGSTLFDYF